MTALSRSAWLLPFVVVVILRYFLSYLSSARKIFNLSGHILFLQSTTGHCVCNPFPCTAKKSDTIEQLLEVNTGSTSMAGIKSLIGLALAGSAGMTLLILACTMHQQNWWPAIVTIFYLAVPFPILISRHVSNDGGFSNQSNPSKEWAYFLTTGIIISALALPVVMDRVGTIETAATILSLASSTFFFTTILAFFVVFQSDDNYIGGIY